MDTSEQRAQSTSFKFPFTDNEDADLNLSKSFHEFRAPKTPVGAPSYNEFADVNFIASPSDMNLGLSPIAVLRDSDASVDSCVKSSGEECEPQIPISVENTNDATKSDLSTTGLEIDKLIPPDDHSSPSKTDDLHSAMKKVGERSSNFIDKIRNAAHKRKVAVTRSRDSLVAKEQEQLRSIAESKTRLLSLNEELQIVEKENEETTKESVSNTGKSKPKHSYKNNKGGFGGVGVPKVEKRPTTTPLSPMLGSRRKGGGRAPRLVENSRGPSGRGLKNGPTAKAIDRSNFSTKGLKKVSIRDHKDAASGTTNGRFAKRGTDSSKLEGPNEEISIRNFTVVQANVRRWNAGQIGIPKVSKRAVTVPVSPCLGPKRQSRIAGSHDEENSSNSGRIILKVEVDASKRANGSISSQNEVMTPSSTRMSPLLGLNLIDSVQKVRYACSESDRELALKSSFKPFVPRSTTRAKMRSRYDILRKEKQEIRRSEERERLQAQIKVIHRELRVLGKDLT